MRQCDTDGDWQQQTPVMFAAQQRAPIRLAAGGPVDCVGIRLQPAASAAIAGDRLAALRDRIVPMGALDAEFAAGLVPAVQGFASHHEDPTLWALLAARLLPVPLDARIQRAIGQLDGVHGCRRVHELAQDAGMSLRGFQVHFLRAVGLAAKEYARILRLQAALRRLDAGVDGLADVAADTGYADQSHATRDLLQLTGLTPARLSRALGEKRDGEQALRLAAAFVRGYA